MTESEGIEVCAMLMEGMLGRDVNVTVHTIMVDDSAAATGT